MQNGFGGGSPVSVAIGAFPTDLGQFTASAVNDLTRPENVCALFLTALDLYTKDKDAGLEAINYLRGPRPLSNYDMQFFRDRLMDKRYLPRVYFDGATPQNNYVPSEPYTLTVYPDQRPQDVEDGYIRVFLRTAGADSPRPIKLRKKGDQWFLWEYSSIMMGVRIPAAEDPWA